jgi:hypothetical protein
MRILLLSFLFLSMVACKQVDESNETATDELTEEATFFGEDFDATAVVSYDEMLAQLAGVEGEKEFVVKGNVDGVCQTKGCWMNIVSVADTSAESMFVKFKDYGFFMPKDLTGEVILKGSAYYEETTVDELKHYAEDEGLSQEEIDAITEPIKELKFMASGVKLGNN